VIESTKGAAPPPSPFFPAKQRHSFIHFQTRTLHRAEIHPICQVSGPFMAAVGLWLERITDHRNTSEYQLLQASPLLWPIPRTAKSYLPGGWYAGRICGATCGVSCSKDWELNWVYGWVTAAELSTASVAVCPAMLPNLTS